jgi:hypothetical protein
MWLRHELFDGLGAEGRSGPAGQAHPGHPHPREARSPPTRNSSSTPMQAGANRQMMFRAVSRAFASGSTQRMRLLERTAIRGRGWKLLLLEPWYIIQQGALTLCPPGRDRKQRTRMADQTTPSSPAKIDLAAIVASAKRALPGQTPASLREYSFSYDPVSKKILLKAETERTPTEQELDDLQVAESESTRISGTRPRSRQ